MEEKQRYKIRNWRAYNRALINRGSLTVWFAEDSIANRYEREKNGQRGRDITYSDTAIQCLLVIKQVFQLPLRATTGLVRSLLELMGLDLHIPCYSQVCRRQSTLSVQIPPCPGREGLHVVVDSTGLKVFGEGEWKARKHGVSKRRTWRKVHLGIDAATHEVVAAMVTTNAVGDGEVLPDLLDQIADPIKQLSGDGAYDTHACYQAIAVRGAQATIPRCENATLWSVTEDTPYAIQRNTSLARIDRDGREIWKQQSGYHRRSLAETAMFRLKTLFRPTLKARRFESQVA